MNDDRKVTSHDFLAMCLAAYREFLPMIGGVVLAMLIVYGLVMLL